MFLSNSLRNIPIPKVLPREARVDIRSPTSSPLYDVQMDPSETYTIIHVYKTYIKHKTPCFKVCFL